MNIQEVPYELVNQVLPKVEHYIAAALEFAQGDYTVDDIRVLATNGTMKLVVAFEEPGDFCGVMVVQYYNSPHARAAFVVAFGGKGISSHENFEKLKAIFVSNGATRIEGGVRDSMLRLASRYGLTKKYSIISAQL